jgi:predicted nucleic acid-binding protein
MTALDTNIWIYSHDTRDPAKQRAAQELIRTAKPLALPWQVGCEFIAASRKLEPHGFKSADAWAALEQMRNMADVVLLPDVGLWSAARDLQDSRQLPFWDALLVAACLRGGVKTLYSEDLQDGARFDGMVIANPFAP